MVKSIRDAELIIGEVDYNLTPKQQGKNIRSLYVSQDVKKGELTTIKM